ALMNKAIAEGTYQILMEAGGVPMPTVCGICAGKGAGQIGAGEICVSSANRNYKGRMGSVEGSIYLASAATVAASAVQGRVADPRELLS
ncbi:MAG: aconitase family protein, partial [bacterium]